jgi:hypothetical protein
MTHGWKAVSSAAALALALGVSCAAARIDQGGRPKPAAVRVPPAEPRLEDISTLDGIIAAFYEVISGPAGEPRQWSRDRTLYIPGVRFVAMTETKEGRPLPEVTSHQQYVDRSDAELVENGFFESEIHRVTRRFGNIAHVFSTYEIRREKDGPVLGRGVNSLELYWDGSRWWIAAATWETERQDNPIPADLLPERLPGAAGGGGPERP